MLQTPACTKCKNPLPVELINAEDLQDCPRCSSPVQVEIFPAFFRPVEKGSTGEALVVESESSCFYHPQKKAAVVCASCGRFICSLCDVEFGGHHLCPPCLESAEKKGSIKSLQNKRVQHDSLALALAVLPLIFMFYITFITAPAALYWAIKTWNTPSSIRHRTKIRSVLAIIFASLEILAWLALIGYFLFR